MMTSLDSPKFSNRDRSISSWSIEAFADPDGIWAPGVVDWATMAEATGVPEIAFGEPRPSWPPRGHQDDFRLLLDDRPENSWKKRNRREGIEETTGPTGGQHIEALCLGMEVPCKEPRYLTVLKRRKEIYQRSAVVA